MKYEIKAEAHEGIFSVDEEVWGIVEADNKELAMNKFAQNEPKIHYCEGWDCWLMGARKVWAEEIK